MGDIRNGSLPMGVQTDTLLESEQDFTSIIVKSYPNGSIVRLKDVADVSFQRPVSSEEKCTYQGKPNIFVLRVFRTSDASTVTLSNDVKRED